MDDKHRRYQILRVIDSMSESSSPYKQFTLPLIGRHEISLCTFYKKALDYPHELTVFSGDGTIQGFFKALRIALYSAEYDIIHVHSPHLGVFFAAGAILFKRTALRRSVYTVHSSMLNYRPRHRIMLVLIMALYRRIVCCSRSSFDSMPKLYRWLAGRRLWFIPNGVNVARIDEVSSRPGRRSEKQPFTIVSIGRLIALKNPLDILESFHRSNGREDCLLFIGDGVLKKDLYSRIMESGMQGKVTITGEVDRDTVYGHLSGADLFISASSVEGLPVAVLEAMACACPVILSDIPAHREIAGDADFIPLVTPGDTERLAREINRYKQMSDAERSDIGEKCRKLADDRFGLFSMHEEYERLFRDIIIQDSVAR